MQDTGSIIQGTINPRDTIPAMLRELARIGGSVPSDVFELQEGAPSLGRLLHYQTYAWIGEADDIDAYLESDAVAFDLGAIVDALNEANTIPDTYYGTHPDDPADFGLWPEAWN